jgi:hypothetical protein
MDFNEMPSPQPILDAAATVAEAHIRRVSGAFAEVTEALRVAAEPLFQQVKNEP